MFIQGQMYRWKLPFPCSHACELAVELNMSRAVASILHNRGYTDKQKAHEFIFHVHDPLLYHPKKLAGAEKAVARIIQALERNEKILIAGDYDVDGITSTSLMLLGLLHCNARVNFFLPHRIHDGYGLSSRMIERAHRNGYTLVITVDNGITAREAIAKAGELSLDVIITDHHQPHDGIPEAAYAIVNPRQPECPYPFKDLAGVGVAFKVIQLLYETLGKELPEKLYELLLLGTVADVVPLLEENRHWVRTGLQQLKACDISIPLKILRENAKIDAQKMLNALDIGFFIAPQLNALGRLDDPREGVQFLLSSCKEESANIGARLHRLNQTRKSIEQEIVESLKKEFKDRMIDPQKEGCVVAYNDSWPAGVVGLVAARMTQHYGVPSCILYKTEDGYLKGSCRSIHECNVFKCLERIPSDLIVQFGGHSHAAGVCIKEEHFKAFREAFAKSVWEQCTSQDLCPKLYLDAYLDLEELNERLWKDLQLLEPFGAGNPSPLFYIPHAHLTSAPQLIKDQHVKIRITAGKNAANIIFFNRPELFHIMQDQQMKACALAGKVTENSWNNKKSIELIGSDIAFF